LFLVEVLKQQNPPI